MSIDEILASPVHEGKQLSELIMQSKQDCKAVFSLTEALEKIHSIVGDQAVEFHNNLVTSRLPLDVRTAMAEYVSFMLESHPTIQNNKTYLSIPTLIKDTVLVNGEPVIRPQIISLFFQYAKQDKDYLSSSDDISQKLREFDKAMRIATIHLKRNRKSYEALVSSLHTFYNDQWSDLLTYFQQELQESTQQNDQKKITELQEAIANSNEALEFERTYKIKSTFLLKLRDQLYSLLEMKKE